MTQDFNKDTFRMITEITAFIAEMEKQYDETRHDDTRLYGGAENLLLDLHTQIEQTLIACNSVEFNFFKK